MIEGTWRLLGDGLMKYSAAQNESLANGIAGFCNDEGLQVSRAVGLAPWNLSIALELVFRDWRG